MKKDFPLGIQSYCFRSFKTIPELADAVKQTGLNYLEIWPRHLPYDSPKEEWEKAKEVLEQNDITVNGYGLVVFKDDEADSRKILEFAKFFGVKSITADCLPEAYPLMEKLLEEYDMNLAFHNHGRNCRYGTIEKLEEAFSKTSKRFGICLDTAWFFDVKQDPFEALEKFKDRLYGVHPKDFAFDADGKHYDVIFGEGSLDTNRLIKRLAELDYDGYLSTEYEGDADNPIPNTIKCVEIVKEAIRAI